VFGEGIETRQQHAAVERQYLYVLDALQDILSRHPFIMATDYPTLVDFGFYGPFFRHFASDPSPRKVMQQRAPAVFHWIGRMWDYGACREYSILRRPLHSHAKEEAGVIAEGGRRERDRENEESAVGEREGTRGEEENIGDGRRRRRREGCVGESDGVPIEWERRLFPAVKEYLAYLHSNAAAWSRGRDSFEFSFGITSTVTSEVQVVPYRVWCRLQLQKRFKCLDEASASQVREIMQRNGLWDIFWKEGMMEIEPELGVEPPFCPQKSCRPSHFGSSKWPDIPLLRRFFLSLFRRWVVMFVVVFLFIRFPGRLNFTDLFRAIRNLF
jgi:hypothetical protein